MRRPNQSLSFVLIVLALIFSFSPVVAQDPLSNSNRDIDSELPFKVKSLVLDKNQGLELIIENEKFFSNTPSELKDFPHYNTYFNGRYLSSSSAAWKNYSEIKNSGISNHEFSPSERAQRNNITVSLKEILKPGKNNMVIGTTSLTVDEDGTFVPRKIVNQYGTRKGLYQRLPNGSFVLCSHTEGEKKSNARRVIDNENCDFEDGGPGPEINNGPDAGLEVQFNLTQKQLNSSSFNVMSKGQENPASVSVASRNRRNSNSFNVSNLHVIDSYMGVPSFDIRYTPGELTEGTRVVVDGKAKPNKDYSIHINKNLAEKTSTGPLGKFREVISLESYWLKEKRSNEISIKDGSGKHFVKPLLPNPSGTSESGNEWAASIFLNDTEGYYGDTVSVYGQELKPNKEYTMRVSYAGIPADKFNVKTNNRGAFHKKIEISPPSLANLFISVKSLFKGKRDITKGDIRSAIRDLESVSIGVEIDEETGGGIGTTFYLCEDAPEHVDPYCN